jgi:hypothetical protein
LRALAAWREHDVACAIHPTDRAAIDATEATRTLVLDLLERAATTPPMRDLFNAGARLGRLLADAGASPSLAANTIEGAARALAPEGLHIDEAVLAPLRASVAEGYLAGIVEAERDAARRVWDWPACAVKLDRETVAIAAGHPTDDAEPLGDWAARVALAASRDGVKQIVVAGSEAARAELTSALSIVGIEVRTDLITATTRSWLRLPWRK